MSTIQHWFATPEALFYWGGPGLTFGLELAAFCDQIKLEAFNSFSLTDGETLLGFGQYFLRLGRYHLSRLAIAPDARGRGLGGLLVNLLCRQASSEQQAEGFSLFVLPDNQAAIATYQRQGFIEAVYPEPMPGGLTKCLYMVNDGLLVAL